MGRVEYGEALEVQRELARRRAAGTIPDTLLLLEHEPVYTTGRRGPGENLRVAASALGAPLVETDRGGDITFHGPGQVVAYPIVALRETGLSVVGFVRRLEDVVVRTLGRLGMPAGTDCEHTGVWMGGDKIAAIGIRVGKPLGAAGEWVTTHGLALNVDVDLGWFERIVPCGIADRGVTSVAALEGSAPSVEEVAPMLADDFGEVFGRRMVVAPTTCDFRHAPA
jgi:lipoate-protein ligase B